MSRVGRWLLYALLALLAITLLFHFWPVEESDASQVRELSEEAEGYAEAALPAASTEPTAKLNRHQRHVLKSAVVAFRRGHEKKARQRLHKIKRAWDEIPLRRLVRAGHRGKAKSPGCHWAGGYSLIEASVLHTDLFRSNLWVHFCNRGGRVRRVSSPNVSTNVHFLGDATGWESKGVVARSSTWERWRGESHGKKVIVRVTGFEQCIGFATGQFCHRERNLAQAVVLLGNGAWGYGDAS